MSWDLSPEQQTLVAFTKRVIKLFHEQPVFHRRRFFHGRALKGAEAREIAWLDPSGKEMSDEAWNAPFVRCLGVQLFGQSIDVDTHGETIRGDTILVLFNADHTHKIPFTLPASGSTAPWELVFDTANPDAKWEPSSSAKYELDTCSMAVFRSENEPIARPA